MKTFSEEIIETASKPEVRPMQIIVALTRKIYELEDRIKKLEELIEK